MTKRQAEQIARLVERASQRWGLAFEEERKADYPGSGGFGELAALRDCIAALRRILRESVPQARGHQYPERVILRLAEVGRGKKS